VVSWSSNAAQFTSHPQSSFLHATFTMRLLRAANSSLSILSSFLFLLPLSTVLAADKCQPSQWSKAGVGKRAAPTSSSSSSAASSTNGTSAASSSTSTSSASAATSSSLISSGYVTPGEINCRFADETGAQVNYYSCTELASSYQITNEEFFSLNPGLNLDCSNIKPNTEYCVIGCKCKTFTQDLLSQDFHNT
jgi:hypothetical protein